MTKALPRPKDYHAVTPHLVIKGAAEAIEFYKKAFGAQELARMPGPDGKSIMHAELKIGDSIVMLADEFPDMDPSSRSPKSLNGSSVALHVYVDNVDQAFDQALKAGATPRMPVNDMFWGDRYGKLEDPFGHHWSLATHIEDLSNEEIAKRGEAFFKQMASSRK